MVTVKEAVLGEDVARRWRGEVRRNEARCDEAGQGESRRDEAGRGGREGGL